MKNFTPRKPRTTSLSMKGIGPLPLSYLVVLAICGCVIAAGFLLAARQHFMSMDLGMKNSKLRKQLEDLETEQRRLVLAREVALSPKEQTLAVPLPVPVVKPSAPEMPKASVVKASASAGVPVLTKTAYQRPVPAVAKSEPPKKANLKKPSRNG